MTHATVHTVTVEISIFLDSYIIQIHLIDLHDCDFFLQNPLPKNDIHTDLIGLCDESCGQIRIQLILPDTFWPDNLTELLFHFTSLFKLTSCLRCLPDWMDGWSEILLEYCTGHQQGGSVRDVL